MPDLTRWNRAGLSRFDYLDGNAAVYLERLRAGLAAAFPAWRQVLAEIPEEETSEARKQRLEALYQADPDDMLWQLTRQFARACHVLGGHIDAYANEAYLGTASQWDNLRRLVALLDYAPRPPASAGTPLALFLKPGLAGTVAAGLPVKHSPASGAPLVFETLADLDADSACNTLHARDHDRNPHALGGHTLILEGRHDKLKSGEPVVLEDERDGRLSAHTIQGVRLDDAGTVLTVNPAIPAGYLRGWTVVHGQAKDRLAPLGPAATGVDAVGHGLQLAVPADGLAAGDIVMVRSGDDKPWYRRIKAVGDRRLVFYRAIGRLTLAGATVARPVTVPLTMLDHPAGNRKTEGDTVIDAVYAAGDWSRLADQWLADIRVVAAGRDRREYLPMYYCLHANYCPVGTERVPEGARPGYTVLTLTWHPDTDDVPGTTNLALNNPQTLLAPPPAPGPWPVDRFLNKSADGRLPPGLVTEACKQAAAGDLAVVAKGGQMAWARLASVALDPEHGEATLTAEGVWQDRGGGPFFLAASRVYSHFVLAARVLHWQVNDTPLSGRRVWPEALPAILKTGRAVIVDTGGAAVETAVAGLDPARTWLDLADDLPPGCTAGNLTLYANVVAAGHGESRPERVLGSGDGTLANQSFTLEVADLAYAADAAMGAGVRAEVEVAVAGETWTQVASLKDSGPSDAHYQVRIDQDGHAGIQFGDGRHGRRLPSGAGNVRVAFRQGAGAAGNLPAGCFAKPARPHSLVASVAQPLAASGGADREDNAGLRVDAPATLLALDRAVSLADYAKLARGHASVWQARAFRRPPGLGQRERIEVVVMAAGGGTLSAALKQDLAGYLAARAQPGVAIAVNDYQRLGFGLDITLRVRTDAYDAETVRDAVLAALAAAFSEQARQLGQVLYRGEVYQTVDGVAGVENSDCRIVLATPPAGAAPARVAEIDGAILTATPGAGQCLALDGATLTVKEYGL